MTQPPPVLVSAEQRPARLAGTIAIVAALAACVAALYIFDPARGGFYPRCVFHMATGLDCPGCGGLRAVHQLLHGNIGAAFAFNPLFVSLLPIAILAAGWTAIRRLQKRPPKRLMRNPRFAWGLAILVIAFGVLRNLPWRSL
jgi:hypothetical protein